MKKAKVLHVQEHTLYVEVIMSYFNKDVKIRMQWECATEEMYLIKQEEPNSQN